jgi:hypothetical protein
MVGNICTFDVIHFAAGPATASSTTAKARPRFEVQERPSESFLPLHPVTP